MPKVNWTNRKKVLTKKEMKHLNKDAGCRTKSDFQNTINMQAQMRKDNQKFEAHRNLEPCWDCRVIAEKLNMKAV